MTVTKKFASLSACAVLAFTGVVLPTVTASGTSTTRDASALAAYGNCTALNRDYSHGISNRHMTKRQWIRKGATGKGAYRPKLYKRVSANLDRDKDHIACEK